MKEKRSKWLKGNGSMIIGTTMMLGMLVLTYGSVQTFLIQNNGWNAQLASDSIADGTAVYMATDGENYNDAIKKANKLQQLVKDVTGCDIQNVTINKEKLEKDNEVEVNLNLKDQYISKKKMDKIILLHVLQPQNLIKMELPADPYLELQKVNWEHDIIGQKKDQMNLTAADLSIGVISRQVQQAGIRILLLLLLNLPVQNMK